MSEPASAFSPLPLRARGVLELLDTSLKVYKQYFWTLLGWSALLNILGALASLVCGGFGQFLFTPIFLGVVACCVAAAVRGQNVSFSQCWQFAQARFGGMLGWFLLAALICFVALLVLCGLFVGLFVLVAQLVAGTDSTIGTILTISYAVLASAVVSIASAGLFTWAHMAPLVVCMEENNADKRILPRSWALMQGHWVRATTLMTILSLAAGVLLVIIWSAGALIIGIDNVRQAFEGSSTPSILLIAGGMVSSSVLLFTLFTPAFLIAIVLLYLDIRVRKDALDLEWTTHATAPPPSATTMMAPSSISTAPVAVGFENLTTVQPPIQTPIAPLPIQMTIAPPQTPIQSPPTAPAPAPTPTPLAPLPATTVFEVPDFENPPLSTSATAPQTSPETVSSWQSLIETSEPAAPAESSTEAPNATAQITCAACGKQSPPNYLFCMSCGAPLSNTPLSGPAAPLDSSAPDSTNTPKW